MLLHCGLCCWEIFSYSGFVIYGSYKQPLPKEFIKVSYVPACNYSDVNSFNYDPSIT